MLIKWIKQYSIIFPASIIKSLNLRILKIILKMKTIHYSFYVIFRQNVSLIVIKEIGEKLCFFRYFPKG